MIKGEEVYVTNDFRETQRLGKAFVEITLKEAGAVVIALYGELGGGKTTFVQGLAKGFGIKGRIISPTFIIIRRHKLKPQISKLKATTQNSKLFYHIDLYRVEGDDNIKGLGLEEIVKDPQNIVAIEWAEKMGNLLPRKRWDIKFEYLEEEKRRITISDIRTK